MNALKIDPGTITCNACQKPVKKEEIRFMSLRMCCSIERVPLCGQCWGKYGKKPDIKREEEK